ncbi:hypothetical protein F5X99DRAFT_53425 [Biscogniauxia marginata]|nr:hypothetical protein F5X99DRAFT_53425 [Biscogniauxia marginata]
MCIRAAILLDWIRIFVPQGTRNAFFWTNHILLWAIVVFYTSAKLVENLQCFPRQKTWDITIHDHCINQRALILAVSIVNLVADLVILAVPQMAIWKLHLAASKKLGVSITFAVASLYACALPLLCIKELTSKLSSIAVAAIRIVASIEYLDAEDATYHVGTVIIAGHAEMALLFLVACIPMAPKAIGGLGLPKAYTSLKSWVKSHNSRQPSRTGASWPDTTGDKVPRPNAYQQIEGYSLDRSRVEHGEL